MTGAEIHAALGLVKTAAAMDQPPEIARLIIAGLGLVGDLVDAGQSPAEAEALILSYRESIANDWRDALRHRFPR